MKSFNMKKFIKTATASTGAKSATVREVAALTISQLALLDEKTRNQVFKRY